MLNHHPMVSVVIPYFNGKSFIKGAIESIIVQSYQNLEILIVDDGSTESISSAIQDLTLPVRILGQSNKGPAAARNKAIKAAKGDIIAFLDVDDRWPEGKLEKQLKKFESDAALGIVTGRIEYRSLAGADNKPIQLDENNSIIHVHLGAALVKKNVFDEIGLFDESLRFSEDHDWFLRAREHAIKTLIMEDITLIYQLHAQNMTHGKTIRDVGVMDVLRRSLKRRKVSQGEAKNLPNITTYNEVYYGQ